MRGEVSGMRGEFNTRLENIESALTSGSKKMDELDTRVEVHERLVEQGKGAMRWGPVILGTVVGAATSKLATWLGVGVVDR